MIVLGIESSCDETAASVVKDGHTVQSSVISSQVAKHAEYGGVIPELAAREHLKAIRPIVDQALSDAGVSVQDIDGIAVTQSPGLLPALLVGLSYAKGLVSGGHTALLLVESDGQCRIVGRTLDDAAGEAFDKAAKILHLPYPGGPVIDQLAKEGNREAHTFPKGLCGEGGQPIKPENTFNFSFSGVKTSLLYKVKGHANAGALDMPLDITHDEMCDFVASYQESIVDVLVKKFEWAADEFGAKTLVICGGVACNSRLRAVAAETLGNDRRLIIAPPRYCTDNLSTAWGFGPTTVRPAF